MTEITDERLDLDALERVADAATPGEWSAVRWYGGTEEDGGEDFNVWGPRASRYPHDDLRHADYRPEDAQHIATFDPPTVKALIRELREALARATAAERGRDEARALLARLNAELDAFWNEPAEIKYPEGRMNPCYEQLITVAQMECRDALARAALKGETE